MADSWDSLAKQYGGYQTPESLPGPLWYPLSSINEPFTGAWQRNISSRPQSVSTYNPVFASIQLISSDVGKVRPRLMEQDSAGTWKETSSPTFSPVLEDPNDYQERVAFLENWVINKLVFGNTYVWKERDNRGIGPMQGAVRALHILDSARTRAFVAADGSVWYQTARDNLAGVDDEHLMIPASEIVHDRMNAFYHPLCGISPLVAAALPAVIGNKIQMNSASFFGNASRPSGILIAPGRISKEDAQRLKQHWEEHYSGENIGRVAVVGDNLKYEAMGTTALDAQLIEQLKWSAEQVASCFGIPAHKIGAGVMPNLNNIEALDQQYYSQCLQKFFTKIEQLYSRALGLSNVPGKTYAIRFDYDDLFQMDTATLMKALSDGVRAGVLAPNEGRKRIGYGPVPGGDSPYLQHQDYSLAALAKRDSKPDPFAGDVPAPSAPPAIDPPPEPQKSADSVDLDLDLLGQLVALEANQQLRLLSAA